MRIAARSIILVLAGIAVASCSRTVIVDVPTSGETGGIYFYAKGDLLNGYDLYVASTEAASDGRGVRIYCTLDRPEYAADYIKGYELDGGKLVIFLADDNSCGESVSGKSFGRKVITVRPR